MENFRSKFENLGNSFTEEDASQDSKYGYTSERSYFEPSGPYSVQYPYSHKSTEWVSYEQESGFPSNSDLQANKQFYNQYAMIQEQLYSEIESLKDDKKMLNSEISHLKVKITDLENQIDSFQEKIQKKDKDLSKLAFDKELSKKTEEEFKKIIEDLKKKIDSMHKENLEHRQNFENFRLEKRDLLKNLKESEMNLQQFEESLKGKDEIIRNLELALEEANKPEIKSLNSLSCKNPSSKFTLKPLELEKRGISDSPERKNLQLSDRSEDFYKNFYLEAKKILATESFAATREKLVKLREIYSKYKKTEKFIKKLANMVLQCSPSGSFEAEPTSHQIWKWLTRLLEEYMKLKQSLSGESFNKLCGVLGATSIEDVLEKVIQLKNRGNFRNA